MSEAPKKEPAAGKSAPWTVNGDGSVSVPLKRPIETHDGKVSVLIIREPTADSYFRYGPPFDAIAQTNEDGDVTGVQTVMKAAVLAKYLAACTDHDEAVLGQMSVFDAQRAGNAMVSVFFGDAGN